MEFIGRIAVQNKPKLPSDLEQFINKYKVVSDDLCVGYSKNNFLVEFSAFHGDIKKGVKLDSTYDNLEIIHDFNDKYVVLLTRPENCGFCVYQPNEQTFQKVQESTQYFIGYHVQDDQGRQILHIQYSPSRSEAFDFAGSHKNATIKEPLQEQVSTVLAAQRNKAKKAVSDLRKEVQDLEHTLELAISDLTLNNVDFSLGEAEVLQGLFDGRTLKRSKSKVTLELSDIKVYEHDKAKKIWIQINNTSEFTVVDLQLVLLSSGQVQVLELDLETMLKTSACNHILNKNFASSSKAKAHQELPTLQPGETHKVDFGRYKSFEFNQNMKKNRQHVNYGSYL